MRKVLRKDERGISAVIVVVSLLGIFGAALLSLDAGNMWQTRRNIITATDATALKQAAFLAQATPGSVCQDTWRNLLLQNGGDGAEAIDCVPTWGANGLGYVGVDGRKVAATRFGGLFGIGDTHPYSYSVAQWGFPTSAKGLRPIGICKDNPHFVEWMRYRTDATYKSTYENLTGSDHPAYASAENTVHRLDLTHMNDQPCGGAPGNWGWLGFDGVPADPNEIADWLRNGWDEDVTIRVPSEPACPPGSGDADDSAEGCVPSDSGIGNSSAVNSALTFLLNKPIYILVFDVADCTPATPRGPGRPPGGGVNCDFEAYTFLNVTLRGFDMTGNPKYMDFEFTTDIISGKCCAGSPPNGVDAGGRSVALCDVDHSKFQRNETTTNPCAL